MANNLGIPKVIYLYNEGVKGVDFKEFAGFIKKNFGNIPVKIVKLKERIVHTKGLLLDPIKTNAAFEKMASANKDACHIIVTDRLFATFDEDKKLHIRASIYSDPSIVSTSGIVEGPAKPRDYYLYKDRFLKLGAWPIEEPKIKKRFKSRFIDYGDKRITEVLKGYISQVIFFYITGEPFCTKRSCRLFNAHWQEDLIYSQVKMRTFCPAHRKMLGKLEKK
ncbi:MAG: hypothetical protein HZA30_04245 [Candidatus Omnitrophica bacterium]|nr:hypothetical protein [Candidatus Omnitrophota bacterium]